MVVTKSGILEEGTRLPCSTCNSHRIVYYTVSTTAVVVGRKWYIHLQIMRDRT